jgi:CheY-like chemotaxis protein
VLVVDDEADAQALVRMILDREGASTEAASSASEALASLDAGLPDVIVSDLGMPDHDGLAMMTALRGGRPHRAATCPPWR